MLFRRKKEKIRYEEIKVPGKSVKKIKERKYSLKKEKTLLPPMPRWKYFFGKVSFCIFGSRMCKGSLAVETAMVLPMFFLGMVTMISFIDVYKLQTEHLTALCEKAKETGMYAYVAGDVAGELTIPDVYIYQPVGGLVPLSSIWMYNSVKIHAWTGSDSGHGDAEGENSGEEGEMVYVTESGRVYHKHAECTYLDLSIQQVSGASTAYRRNASGERYHACDSCSRGESPAGQVWITKTGNCYHNSQSCSGLKRTVRMVSSSYAEGMDVCSRCG